uniref:Solute carrier organic anion transporter family member n=1 Tax=Denticeps clupeoides TaxID=299321 RepID=A0AAY4BF17_9TELE
MSVLECVCTCVFVCDSFQGSYMKSSVTQIERRFDIPSTFIGVIDGSFEIGNLLVIAFVSYFGAKLHRPRLIGAGCLIMAVGSFCTALPHFFQGPFLFYRYKYETTITQSSEKNLTHTMLPCQKSAEESADGLPSADSLEECEKAAGSSLWAYVFLGNMLRGIGETPVMPLGLSYLDDFSQEENTALYLVGIIGPMFGFLLGSFCARLYVDIGAVDLDVIAINHKDSRWVGAWWLGFLVTGAVMLLAGIPFWFLPKSLPKQESKNSKKAVNGTQGEQGPFLPQEGKSEPSSCEKQQPVTMASLAKGRTPDLFQLVSGFIGMITFKPKFMEQTYGQSSSKAIFMIGIMNLPAVALGIITGGFVMKRFKLSILGAARVSVTTSLVSFCLLLTQYFLQCRNAQVAGLTVSYEGLPEVSYEPETLLAQCNTECSCSLKHWDPVCASNGITYANPCLAGCQTATGFGKDMVFHNCTCIGEVPILPTNMSATLGQCSRSEDCDKMFKFYMAISVLGAFVSACGATPGYIVLLRSISSDLKSLALGMQTLIVRTLGGIPPPIYFGALIDQACLKWGTKRCGGRGACRLYDTDAFRSRFLGLIYGLYALSYVLWALLYKRLVQRHKKKAAEPEAVNQEGNDDSSKNTQDETGQEPEKETNI